MHLPTYENDTVYTYNQNLLKMYILHSAPPPTHTHTGTKTLWFIYPVNLPLDSYALSLSEHVHFIIFLFHILPTKYSFIITWMSRKKTKWFLCFGISYRQTDTIICVLCKLFFTWCNSN